MANSVSDIQLLELKDTISQLNKTIENLNQTIEEGRKREAVLQEQIDYLTKKLFGKSSEKHLTQIEGQMSLFDEAEVEADSSAPEPDFPEVEVKSHTRKPKSKNNDKYANLPVEKVILELSDRELICPQCGSKLIRIGEEYIREEIEFIPATMRRVQYYSVTYKCDECCSGKSGASRGYLIKTAGPDPIMKKSPASVSSVAWVMYQKYNNAIPLYRQEEEWKTLHGATITRATLANWIITCAKEYLKPLYEYFHKELIKRRFLMADETTTQVLKEPGRSAESTSYMWLFRTGEDGEPPIILYHYSQTRARTNAASFLQGFEGYLMTDGYQGYNDLPGVKRCACYAHIRRAFADAIPKGSEKDFSNPAVQGVEYCDKLFYYERMANDKGFTYEERKKYRLEKEKPILDAFWKWLEEQKPARNSRMYKAVNYVMNRKSYAETYLEDGRCSFSNNPSENSIRPYTVGRKNWLFSDSQKGAEASSICYTMVEMAKANDLNVLSYLNYILLNRLPKGARGNDYYKLAPWNPQVKKACMNNPSNK